MKKHFDYFHLENDKEKLKSQSVKGGFFTIAGQAVKFILTTLGTIVLARILSPDDFGIIGMATIIINFVALFKDAGLGTATIQQTKITHDQISTLFWINIGISVILMLILIAISPLIAFIYNKPELINVTIALTIPILFGGAIIQQQALLRRELKFGTMVVIETISIILSNVIAIILAYLKFNYWAIIHRQISFSIFMMLGFFIFCSWKPSRPVRKSGVRNMLIFGKDISIASIINFFKNNIDFFLVGKFLGETSLGLYTKSFNLLMLPIRQLKMPLQGLMLPILSSLQDKPVLFKKYVSQYFEIISIIFMPIMVFLGIFSEKCILLILGPQWIESAWMFSVFSIVGIIFPIANSTALVLKATGQSKRNLTWTIINGIITVVALCIGIIWGIKGILISLVSVYYLLFCPSFIYCTKNTPIDLKVVLKAISAPLFVSLSLGGFLLFIKLNFNPNLAISLLITILFYFLIWIVIPPFRKKLLINWNLILTLKNRKKK